MIPTKEEALRRLKARRGLSAPGTISDKYLVREVRNTDHRDISNVRRGPPSCRVTYLMPGAVARHLGRRGKGNG